MRFSKTVIVAGDADLAEEACALLRKQGIYLPVIEAPMVRLVEYGVFANDCVRVANAVRALKPKSLLFLRVCAEVVSEFHRRFPDLEPIVLDALEGSAFVKSVKHNNTPIHYQDLLVHHELDYASNLFVVEGVFGLSHVIAANLAVLHGGRILPIVSVSKSEGETLKTQFHVWSNNPHEQRIEAKEFILRFAKARLPKELLNSSVVESISFVTSGFPYGILPFPCPTTHYFEFPLLGLSVLSGMLKSQDMFRCPVAVLIDPNLVGESEFQTLRQSLGSAGYHLRAAFGNQATAQDATYLCDHLPSDLIFFSTHCGEVKGRRVVEKFPDRNGQPHVICYDLAVSAYPAPGSDRIEW